MTYHDGRWWRTCSEKCTLLLVREKSSVAFSVLQGDQQGHLLCWQHRFVAFLDLWHEAGLSCWDLLPEIARYCIYLQSWILPCYRLLPTIFRARSANLETLARIWPTQVAVLAGVSWLPAFLCFERPTVWYHNSASGSVDSCDDCLSVVVLLHHLSVLYHITVFRTVP